MRALRAAAGGRGRGRARLRASASTTTRSRRRWSTAAEERGPAAARGAAPHPLPRHQQGRLGGDRRRPVPGGHRGLRGAARADASRARRTRARRRCSPGSPPRSTAGPRCTTPPAPSSPPPRTGRPPRRPAHRRRGTAARPARARERRGRRRRTPGRTGSSCSPSAPAAAPRGRARRGHRPRRSAPPSGTPCTPPIALLTLTTERSRALQEAEQRLGAAVLRMLLAGEPDHARAVAGTLYGGLLDAPLPAADRRGGAGPRTRGRHAAAAAPNGRGGARAPARRPVTETRR